MKRSGASSADPAAGLRRAPRGPSSGRKAEPARPSYVEITVTLSRAAADLAATLLIESGATAVAVTGGMRPRIRTHLPDGPSREATLTRLRRSLALLRSLGVDPGPARIVTRRYSDPGWATRWKGFFRPVRIGRRLVITPSWETTVMRESDLGVELDPGMAFGTGRHATTRMCLELLETAFEQFTVHSSGFRVRSPESAGIHAKSLNHGCRITNRPPAVLDLGTGSGLLAIAAMRFGAGTVVALDTDQVACRIASENVGRNGGDGRIVVIHGSLETVGRKRFDVVLANLTEEGLISLAPRLARSVRPGGVLIVSGILRHQERGVMVAFRGAGMMLEKARRGREWAGLMLRRPVTSPSRSR